MSGKVPLELLFLLSPLSPKLASLLPHPFHFQIVHLPEMKTNKIIFCSLHTRTL